jgi:D-glycero-D-manno-heptose 1,7-bisphosphate phosphatase
MKRTALFLDRDGVINIDHGYVHQIQQCEFIPGIFDLVRCAHDRGHFVVVVTNQAGIGRGYYDENAFNLLMQWMRQEFCNHGGKLDAVYFSPFHPEHGIGPYRRSSDCRKPAPGMILKASKEHDINLKKSILIGDRLTDLQAGLAAGIGQLVHYNPELEAVNQNKTDLGLTITDLRQAIPLL